MRLFDHIPLCMCIAYVCPDVQPYTLYSIFSRVSNDVYFCPLFPVVIFFVLLPISAYRQVLPKLRNVNTKTDATLHTPSRVESFGGILRGVIAELRPAREYAGLKGVRHPLRS